MGSKIGATCPRTQSECSKLSFHRKRSCIQKVFLQVELETSKYGLSMSTSRFRYMKVGRTLANVPFAREMSWSHIHSIEKSFLRLTAYYLNESSAIKPVGHFGIHTQHDYDKATKIRHFKIGDNCIDIGRYGPLRKQDRKVRLTGWKVWNLNSLFSPKTCAQQSSA